MYIIYQSTKCILNIYSIHKQAWNIIRLIFHFNIEIELKKLKFDSSWTKGHLDIGNSLQRAERENKKRKSKDKSKLWREKNKRIRFTRIFSQSLAFSQNPRLLTTLEAKCNIYTLLLSSQIEFYLNTNWCKKEAIWEVTLLEMFSPLLLLFFVFFTLHKLYISIFLAFLVFFSSKFCYLPRSCLVIGSEKRCQTFLWQ